MSSKLIISDFYKNILLGFLFENDELIRIQKIESNNVVGNIYCGYVRDVVKNINACFVDFDHEQKGFLSNTMDLKCGDKVLVQVISDKIKTKDYALSTKIELKSENLILVCLRNDISVSKKIKTEERRTDIRNLLKPYLTEDYGYIVRTSAQDVSDEDLVNEANKLISELESLKDRMKYAMPKTCLINSNSLKDIILEYKSKYKCQIITDNDSVYEQIKELGDVTFNEDSKISLYNKYSLDKHLKESTSKHVWLKSGGYLIIEPTEALTVIDVNTGKADLKTGREESIKKINFEAAKEIVRQLKVRNISGIIVVDFINMTNDEYYTKLQEYIEEMLVYDYSKSYAVGFTKLGLLEMTRKKTEKSIYEILV